MSIDNPIKIMVVDDHNIVRQGLISILDIQPDMEVVAEASDGSEAIERFLQYRPDVTLIDLRLPIISGVEVVKRIMKELPNSRFIALTTFDGDEEIYNALSAGVYAYLLKDIYLEDLLEAIRVVYKGNKYLTDSVGERLSERITHPGFTPRELEILKLMSNGRKNKEISELMGISHGTVRNHVSSILNKLQVNDRTQAVIVAVQKGIIQP
jgi:two-component system, NarL family, response regulator